MPKMPSNQSAANRFNPTDEAQSHDTNVLDDTPSPQGEEVEFVKALITTHTGTSTVVEVPEWEIDILREIHGAESIQVMGSRMVNYPHSAWEALQYLRNKYNTRDQEDIIKLTYPRLKDFARSTGLPYQAGDDAKTRVQASSVIYHDNPNTAEAKTSANKQGAAGSGTSRSAAA